MKKVVSILAVCGLVSLSTSCVTMSNSEQGAVVGALGGALIGSLIGDSTGDAVAGAIIGAAIGGMAGAYIGGYMDRQAAEMRGSVGGAEVERLGEGILVSFELNFLFGPGGFELLVAGRDGLDRLAVILDRYPDTHIFIEGRAFRPGTYQPDYPLAERRARVVADYLRTQNVRPDRFTVRGYDRSMGANDRFRNRRMGLAVMADDNLKRTARARAR
ncbi:MAG TPA: glycine zipper domain-containing protein [Burkholderiales bacterium]|nr:glycine zipper domain-containing protein [Burkholderiales bacterium]